LYKLNNYLLLTLFSLLLLLPGIAKMPVLDRDEAHFAQASRQMLETGNYFQIRFQERTRFQKPPGINWLQAASVKLFSRAQKSVIWPYRLPSVLGALFSVLLLYFFSRRFIGSQAAKWAALFLSTTLLLVVEAHMAVIDTSLLSAVILMQGALWVIYQEGADKSLPWGWAALFWFAMAYGFLLKGVTPLVGLLTLVTLCLIEKRVRWLRNIHPVKGVLFFCALSLTWLYLVNEAEGTNYLMKMINKDLLPKLKGGHESHGKPPLFHLLMLPLTLWPASLFLWQSGVYAVIHRQEKAIKFLLAWLLPTWIFFECMPTKLPQYVLPVFPVLAILAALVVVSSSRDGGASKILRFLQFLWVVLSFGIAVSLTCLPYFIVGHFNVVGLLSGAGILLMTLVASYFVWINAYYRAGVAVLLLSLVSYPLIFTGLLPQLKPLWLSANVAALIDQKAISDDNPLLVVGFEEPSLVFNLSTHRVRFVPQYEAQGLLRDPSRIAVIDPLVLTQWLDAGFKLNVLGQTRGLNYSKGKWSDLIIVSREKGVSYHDAF
jgi:4-amino-4-deoxy-L-arabinose transferase-like glycosyltransferase